MWDDTTPRAQQIGAWLDSPMDLGEFYGRPTFARCAVVLASGWPCTPCAMSRRALCCARCHFCLDQGVTLTKAEKKATWEWAYTRWSAARASKLQEAA
ncbi:hypothetical protein [Achromobacter xylosoxidans]|uniref:hypothetical protein n=1 Tax=Alcaligenes xylosoxydans xylosoxydans TaxID=85698 RepID=UPI0011DD6B37|nr:hypothetical protein [Achromobacter xylosoxidans]WPQ34357.1 hypothetical protein SLH34_27705 [Achromobacter xylosoxidans]